MSAIITNQFRVKNAKDFISSVSSRSVYMTLGRVAPWADDLNPPIPTSAYAETNRGVWDEVIAAKRITSAGVAHVIPRNNWESGDLSYVPYDPNDAFLFTKKFHTTVNDNGFIKIYKLIVKGPGPTTVKPIHTTANLPAARADGYVWKYMYTVPVEQFMRFSSDVYIPVANIPSNAATNSAGLTPAPVGGHGTDNIAELGAYAVAINAKFEFDEGGVIPAQNDFRQVAMIENPRVFNGTAGTFNSGNPASGAIATAGTVNTCVVFNLSSTSGTFGSDTTVTGPSGTATVVSHDTVANKLFVILRSGSFANGAAITATGASGTIGTISAPGLQRYSGDTLYVENRRAVSRASDQTESITTVIEF